MWLPSCCGLHVCQGRVRSTVASFKWKFLGRSITGNLGELPDGLSGPRAGVFHSTFSRRGIVPASSASLRRPHPRRNAPALKTSLLHPRAWDSSFGATSGIRFANSNQVTTSAPRICTPCRWPSIPKPDANTTDWPSSPCSAPHSAAYEAGTAFRNDGLIEQRPDDFARAGPHAICEQVVQSSESPLPRHANRLSKARSELAPK